MVERRELGLAQSLDNCQNGGVDEANAQVGVGTHQLTDPLVVAVGQVLDGENARPNLVDDRRERSRTELPRNHVIELCKHRRGHDPRAWYRAQQLRTGGVLRVLGINGGQQWAGVQD
jgi:hypothetical protein